MRTDRVGAMRRQAKKEPSDQYRMSIIIPAFNEEDGIVDTLTNLEREFPNDEIIVIDDGSTDETVNRVQRFERVRLYR